MGFIFKYKIRLLYQLNFVIRKTVSTFIPLKDIQLVRSTVGLTNNSIFFRWKFICFLNYERFIQLELSNILHKIKFSPFLILRWGSATNSWRMEWNTIRKFTTLFCSQIQQGFQAGRFILSLTFNCFFVDFDNRNFVKAIFCSYGYTYPFPGIMWGPTKDLYRAVQPFWRFSVTNTHYNRQANSINR